MVNIGFAGIPGTGKTTQTRTLSETLKSDGQNVGMVKEYARNYISKHGLMDHIWEEYKVFDTQLAWENAIIESPTEVLITDSPLPLIFMYASALHNPDDKKSNMVFQDIFKRKVSANTPQRYDIIFHCPDVLNADIDDGIREPKQLTSEWRQEHEEFIKILFGIFKPKYFYTIKVLSIEERTEECFNIVKNLQHINNNKAI